MKLKFKFLFILTILLACYTLIVCIYRSFPLSASELKIIFSIYNNNFTSSFFSFFHTKMRELQKKWEKKSHQFTLNFNFSFIL